MTDENHTAREARLAEIGERHAKATPRPWIAKDYTEGPAVLLQGDVFQTWKSPGGSVFRDINRANAEFIAQSRDDIPYLLTELASADAGNDEVARAHADGLLEIAQLEARAGEMVGLLREAADFVSSRMCNPNEFVTRLRTAADHGRGE